MQSLSKALYRAFKELYKESLVKFLAELSGKAFSRASSSFWQSL